MIFFRSKRNKKEGLIVYYLRLKSQVSSASSVSLEEKPLFFETSHLQEKGEKKVCWFLLVQANYPVSLPLPPCLPALPLVWGISAVPPVTSIKILWS